MTKIAILGAGGMGSVHYHNYLHINGAQVSAIIGASDADRAKAKEWSLPYFTSIETLDRSLAINLIDICTPSFLHEEHVRSALIHGYSVICEKPFVLNSEIALALFTLAREKQLFIYVAQVLQYTKELGYIREILSHNTFGKTLHARFERLSSMPKWSAGSWMLQKDKSGLLAFDLHIHDLDMILSFFGKAKSFQSSGVMCHNRDFDEQLDIIYHYEHFNVTAEAAWFDAPFPFSASWRIYFEEAVIMYERGELWVYPTAKEPYQVDITDDVLIPSGINLPPSGWFYNELTSILNDYKNKRESAEVPAERIIDVIALLEQIVR